MFYKASDPHGMKHNPFNALVVPRPIGWISSMDKDGNINLAPYSFFNAVAYHPPQVMFCATSPHTNDVGPKDSVRNILETGEFVHNMATWSLREAVNLSSVAAPHGVDEFDVAGLTKEPAEMVAPPRVKESPIHLECKLVKVVDLPASQEGGSNTVVFGEVVGIHISDAVIDNGMIDIHKVDAIARLGYRDYARVNDIFAMDRPSWPVSS
ncbi:flavin reductase family protein [Pacificispira sp.]|uniref:flavin reductase family protein n=1 Tax=Pacificispira sp. TaxID=2888761 RepID=UPI003BAC6005